MLEQFVLLTLNFGIYQSVYITHFSLFIFTIIQYFFYLKLVSK